MKRICRIAAMFCAAVFLLAPFASGAWAEDAGPFYAGILSSYVIVTDLRSEGAVFPEEVKIDNSRALGAKKGYVVPAARWLGAEVEYACLEKHDIDEPEADFRDKTHNVMANFLLRYPRGRIYPFAGVGIGFSWAEINANVLEESDNALAWQLITGINYEILPNWSADLAYRYLNSRYENENVDAKDENHAIVLGVNYHF